MIPGIHDKMNLIGGSICSLLLSFIDIFPLHLSRQSTSTFFYMSLSHLLGEDHHFNRDNLHSTAEYRLRSTQDGFKLLSCCCNVVTIHTNDFLNINPGFLSCAMLYSFVILECFCQCGLDEQGNPDFCYPMGPNFAVRKTPLCLPFVKGDVTCCCLSQAIAIPCDRDAPLEISCLPSILGFNIMNPYEITLTPLPIHIP